MIDNFWTLIDEKKRFDGDEFSTGIALTSFNYFAEQREFKENPSKTVAVPRRRRKIESKFKWKINK